MIKNPLNTLTQTDEMYRRIEFQGNLFHVVELYNYVALFYTQISTILCTYRKAN